MIQPNMATTWAIFTDADLSNELLVLRKNINNTFNAISCGGIQVLTI